MKRVWIIAFIGILDCCCVATRANDPDSWELTLHFGSLWTDHDRHAENGPLYEVALGHQFTEHVGTELSPLSSQHNGTADGSFDLSALMIDGIISFGEQQRFTPFASLGVGAIRDLPSRVRTLYSFAAQAGGGALIRLWRALGKLSNS
jgi:hypothetical protein